MERLVQRARATSRVTSPQKGASRVVRRGKNVGLLLQKFDSAQIATSTSTSTPSSRNSFLYLFSFAQPPHSELRPQPRSRRPQTVQHHSLTYKLVDSYSSPAGTNLRQILTPRRDTPLLDVEERVQDQFQEQEEQKFTTNRSHSRYPSELNCVGLKAQAESVVNESVIRLFVKKNSHASLHLNEDNSDLRSPARSLPESSNEVDPARTAPAILNSMTSETSGTSTPAQHKPLVVGRTKPQVEQHSTNMDSSSADAALPNEVKAKLSSEIAANVDSNTTAAAPADASTTAAPAGKKKEKAPKQPKQPKAAAPPPAPLSPALIDLRVGHILRAIAHPNADSLYVSTIAMGDPEGTEHTQVDEATGKVVRTVCSGLNGLVPLEEMQNRKVVVVANLKPVNMRSIKSAAMVLAASPAAEEGADPHAADRVVELVTPPEGSEAGDLVFFEGWTYGEGKGPEKQLNPKKKVWESVQPGFFTSEDCVVGFDAGRSEVEGEQKGWLVVEGKGKCTVKTLKGAVVR